MSRAHDVEPRRPLRVYLAGKIPKGNEIDGCEDWRAVWAREISRFGAFEFLTPEDPSLDESQPEVIFGHDCWLVQNCDVVVVNAGCRLGAGTSQEMVIAKHFSKPVYTVLPPESPHRRANLNMHGRVIDDWMHPFVFCTSDEVFDDIETLGRFIGSAGSWRLNGKSMQVVDDAIRTYLQWSSDAEHYAVA